MTLPALYAGWVRDLLGADPAPERRATCADCTMCVKADGTAPTAVYFFQRDVKCCVYQPRLPSFLVGRVLRDGAGPGLDSVRARIAARVGVDPLGLDRPPAYELLFRSTVNAIGNSHALRCPHFVVADGTCGIWHARDSMCSTWFCQHERGAVGMRFWQALRGLLAAIEEELARAVALELGVDPALLARRLPAREGLPQGGQPTGPEVDGVVADATWDALWSGEDPARYYVRAADLVDDLDWRQVIARCGSEVAVRAALVTRAFAALRDTSLPERVVLGSYQTVARVPGGVRAVTHSSIDALDLPDALLPLLPRFDGRPVADVLAELAGMGIQLDPAFLRRLVDWGVLAPA